MLHLRKEIKSGYIYIYGNIYAVYIYDEDAIEHAKQGGEGETRGKHGLHLD